MNPAEALKQTVIDVEWAGPEDIESCSLLEIAELEKHFGISLPESYKEFLRVMGHGAGTFEDDALWTWSELKDARGRSSIYLQEARNASKTTFELSPTHFVFLQGHDPDDRTPYFLFFDTAGGGNPAVYRSSCDGEPQLEAATFNQWLVEYKETIEEIQSLTVG